MTAPGSRQHLQEASRREVLLVTCILTGVVALYLVNAGMHGALGASRNDDWAYLRVVSRFAETNEFSLDGWTHMAFIGQALLAWPIAKLSESSIAAMQGVVAFTAVGGALACYLTIRTLARPFIAGGALALLMIGPIFGSIATSFMTDVPAFCFQMVTVLCGARLVKCGWSSGLFVTMCVAGVVAGSIREYGLVLLATAIVLVWLHARPIGRERTVFLGTAFASGLAAGLMLLWRAGVPNGDPMGVPLTWILTLEHLVNGARAVSRALLTLGVLVAPVAAMAFSGRVVRAMRAAPWRTVWIVAVWLGVVALSQRQWIGNYVTPGGSYRPLIGGSTPVVLSPQVDTLVRWVGVMSLLSLLLLVGFGGSESCVRDRTRWNFVTTFRSLSPERAARYVVQVSVVVLFSVHVALTLTSNTPFFDRYLIAFVPLVVALAATSELMGGETVNAFGRVLGVALVAGLGLLGFAFVDASATIDGAKWRFGERLEAAGFEARTIDAGFEWFNFHQQGVARQEPGPDRNWWTSFYAQTPVCVTVVAGGPAEVNQDPAVGRFVARSALGARYVLDAVIGPSDC